MAAVEEDFSDLASPKQESQTDEDFSDLAGPRQQESIPSTTPKLPWIVQTALNLEKSGMKPLSQAIPERLGAAKQGVQDIGQGLKQLFLTGKEKLGYGSPEEVKKYTEEVEKERKNYEKSSGANDYLSKKIREAVNLAPYGIGAPEALGAKTLLGRMAASGATGGAVNATQFVPEGESRNANIVKGAAIGAGIPLIPGVANAAIGATEKGANIISDIPKLFSEPFKNLSPLEQKFVDASKLAKEAKKEHALSQAEARVSGVSADADEAQQQLFNNQNKLNKLHESLAAEPTVKTISSQEDVLNHEENISHHENALKEAENIQKDTEENIAKHLNKGAEFDVRAATAIEEKQKAINKDIGNGYKSLEKDFAQRTVPVNNEDQIKQKTEEITNLIKSGEARSPEMNAVLSELEGLKNEKPKTAKDYLHALQSIKQYAREAQTKAYKPGMNREERTAWEQRYNELNEKADEISNILEENIPESDSLKLKELNSRWRTQVVPLYKNRVYQGILKNKQMSDNIIKSLRGNAEGNILLKNIIKNDPEILKNVVGQRYAIKPSAIHDPNETMQEYLDRMPELNAMRAQYSSSKDLSKKANEKIKESRKAIEESKINQESVNKRNKIIQQINDIQDKIEQQDKIIEKLRATGARKDISLENKSKAGASLKAAQAKKKEYQNKLVHLGAISAAGLGLTNAYHLGKILTAGNNVPAPPEGE